MTESRELDRMLDLWLADGATEAPDRILGIVVERVGRQSQRPAWRLRWRPYTVNPTLKIGAAVAAVLVVAVIVFNLLPGRSAVIGGPGPSPSPTPSPTPSEPAPIMPEGVLAAGRYRVNPFPSVPSLTVSLSVPAGWQGFQNWAVLGPAGTGAPGGVGTGLLRVDGLFRDPCHWDRAGTGSFTQPDVVVGPTVDDLVAALRASTSYTTSSPVPVTVDGYSGQQLDVLLPSDVNLATCDKATGDPAGTYFVFTGAGGEGGLYAQGPGNRWHLRILDIAGTRLIAMFGDYATTSAADRAAAQAIVDSMQFTP